MYWNINYCFFAKKEFLVYTRNSFKNDYYAILSISLDSSLATCF